MERWSESPAALAEWNSLAERGRNIFGTPEWVLTWWRHWGAGRELRILTCRRASGDLVAVFPLYLAARRPLRVLRFLGHGAGDILGPVYGPEDRLVAVSALVQSLWDECGRWDLLLGQQFPADEGWCEALGAQPLRRESSPILTLQWPTWDDYLASRSANFRQQVRRRARQLARSHPVEFRLTSDPDSLDDDLGRLFALHARRWGKAASTALAPDRQAFHREFAARALERGWLRLWFLQVGGEAVAAWYGFRFGGVESYYQAGRDPGWEYASVGTILLAHTIRSALEDGMAEYRFLRGAERYKNRFTDETVDLETFALGNGVRGVLAASLARQSASARWNRGPLGIARRAIGLTG